MIELFQKGGPTMWPILFLSIIGVAIIVERVIVLMRERTDTEVFLTRIMTALEGQRYEEALAEARAGKGAMARILAAGLEKARRGRGEVEKAIVARGNIEVAKLERGFMALQVVAKLEPLLGFFGTVTGMINSFAAMANVGASDPAAVANGISEALITTAAGLAIAMPVFFAHSMLISMVNKFVQQMEESSIRILDAIEAAEEKQARKLSHDEIGGQYLEI
ncbi:MotA/TolQ/ExbB proton channel family protein [bacterium]|nr:MAG: MotA/TolQ/ExbB proton channel family protein [bacterium]